MEIGDLVHPIHSVRFYRSLVVGKNPELGPVFYAEEPLIYLGDCNVEFGGFIEVLSSEGVGCVWVGGVIRHGTR